MSSDPFEDYYDNHDPSPYDDLSEGDKPFGRFVVWFCISGIVSLAGTVIVFISYEQTVPVPAIIVLSLFPIICGTVGMKNPDLMTSMAVGAVESSLRDQARHGDTQARHTLKRMEDNIGNAGDHNSIDLQELKKELKELD